MINIAIVGYGNLGRGVRSALARNADMELVAVFTRRKMKLSVNSMFLNLIYSKNSLTVLFLNLC